MNIHTAHRFLVRLPDGGIRYMTTTLGMFREHWEPKGYSMKSDLAEFEEPEMVEEAPVEPVGRTRGRKMTRENAEEMNQ